jgi:hypothetical protein
MRAVKYIILILLLSLIVPSCRVYDTISVDCDSINDLSKYKTFAWLPDIADTVNSPYNNEIIRNNLRNYFGKSLSERGFSVNLDTPDVLLRIVIVNNPKVLNVLHPPFPFRFYYSPYYYKSDYYSPYPQDYYYRNHSVTCDPQGYCTEKINYMEGSITLQVIDRLQNKMIWACTAKGDIYDPAFIKKSIHPAVIDIMKKFPVKPIGNKNSKQAESSITLR